MVDTSRSCQIFRFRHSANLACSCGLLICSTTRSLPSILSAKESRMSLINARKNRVHWPKSEVHHSPPRIFFFKTALFISICLQILRENNAKDRIRSWKTYVYITSFDGPKTTFENPELVKLSRCTKKVDNHISKSRKYLRKKSQKASANIEGGNPGFQTPEAFQTPEH